MRQRPNPESKIWEQGPKAETWIQSPGDYTAPPPPTDVFMLYTDGTPMLYTDGVGKKYV